VRCREREDLAVAVNLKVEAARLEMDARRCRCGGETVRKMRGVVVRRETMGKMVAQGVDLQWKAVLVRKWWLPTWCSGVRWPASLAAAVVWRVVGKLGLGFHV